ncbi:hypothetical protein KDV41_21420, partial [Providencia stuartii]|uniref:hypothetical protein n=1 Tax=Providencia stuartii TaxID=588 RepID=UPI00332C1B24
MKIEKSKNQIHIANISYSALSSDINKYNLNSLLHSGKVIILRNKKLSLEDYYQLMLSIGTPEQHILQ